ncbi:MAG: hypothetical protein AAB401_09930 [Acidobacteriota bacterium]
MRSPIVFRSLIALATITLAATLFVITAARRPSAARAATTLGGGSIVIHR